MVTGNFLPKNPDINGYRSGQAGWSGVDLKILPREGLYCPDVCPRTFVNSSGTDGPIWTRQTPKDAPKRRNDDSVCHVTPRATWHVPRAAAWTLSKNTLAGVQPKREESESPNFQGRCTLVWDVCHVSDVSIGSKLCPQGTISFFSLMPSSSETLRAGVTKFGTGGDLDTRYPVKQKILTPQI